MGSGICTICRHEKRAQIELLLAGCRRKDEPRQDSAGTLRRPSIARIARRFGVGRMALQRHWTNHTAPEQRAALVAGPGVDLATAVVFATEKSVSLYEAVENSARRFHDGALRELMAGRSNAAAILYGRALEAARFLAQLNGDLQRASSIITNNTLVLQSPVMADLKAMLLQRLQPHPQALQDVLEGLEELARRAAPSAPAPRALELANG